MMRFYAPFITEATPQVTMAPRSERAMDYDHHFSHSIINITAISPFTPSSTACPVGVQFLPWMRGGSAVLSSTTTYCGMLFWSREHRSSMTMQIPAIDQLPRWGSRVLTVSFPSPAQPLNLCMICEEKNTTTISPALWLLSFHCSS